MAESPGPEAGFPDHRDLRSLAGGVTHALNNYLAVIIGNAGLASEQLADDDPGRREITDIERAARKAADLTRQFQIAASGSDTPSSSRPRTVERSPVSGMPACRISR